MTCKSDLDTMYVLSCRSRKRRIFIVIKKVLLLQLLKDFVFFFHRYDLVIHIFTWRETCDYTKWIMYLKLLNYVFLHCISSVFKFTP